MFFNQKQYGERKGEIKKSRANYFRSYNQQFHRKEYLKECGKIRRLLGKYQSQYQDQRKGDRHKLDSKTRYRLKKITL